MAFNLMKDASERIIVAAHRGECGGNIPCNTMAAYEIAVRHGADMIEVDLNKSADGTLWILHPKMEYRHLNYLGTEGKVSLPSSPTRRSASFATLTTTATIPSSVFAPSTRFSTPSRTDAT